jgi:acetyltransferase-like isoleucine patch superfamily enzyme
MSIHPSAIIFETVRFGELIIIEPFAIIGINDRFHSKKGVIVGDRAFIGSRCTIYDGVVIGDDFDISDQSTIFTDNIVGNHVRIGPKAIVKNGCLIGNHVRINAGSFLERVIINDYVFVGPNVVFTDDPHPACPRYAECVPKTHIESNVSIGANVTIAPGLRIGHHTQIYAGSVLISDVEPYSVMAGNPAKKIKNLNELQCKAGFYERPFSWWK